MQKKWILVLGMHRSGTSALSGLLQECGIEFGKNMIPTDENNPKGYWEHHELISINETILKELNASWHNPFHSKEKINSGWEISEQIKNRIQNFLLSADFCEASICGLKDPRLSFLLPFWEPIFKKIGHSIQCLIMYRNPVEVANSLYKRDHIPGLYSEWLWNAYNLEAEACSRKLNRTWVSLEELIQDPKTVIKKINESLALSLNSQSTNFIEKKLQHHKLQSVYSTIAITSKLFSVINNPLKNPEQWEVLYHEYTAQLKDFISYLDIISEHCLEQTKQRQLLKEQGQHLSVSKTKLVSLEQHLNNLNNHIHILSHELVQKDQVLNSLIEQMNIKENSLNSLISQLVTKDDALNSLSEQLKINDESLKALTHRLQSLHLRQIVLSNLRAIKSRTLTILPRKKSSKLINN